VFRLKLYVFLVYYFAENTGFNENVMLHLVQYSCVCTCLLRRKMFVIRKSFDVSLQKFIGLCM
jgi:hypothetical protein